MTSSSTRSRLRSLERRQGAGANCPGCHPADGAIRIVEATGPEPPTCPACGRRYQVIAVLGMPVDDL